MGVAVNAATFLEPATARRHTLTHATEFTSTGVVYGVADPAVTVVSGARRVGVT